MGDTIFTNKGNDSYEQRIRQITDSIAPVSTRAESFRRNREQNTRRISTGYQSLDFALSGGLANEFYILGAETGTGKSAFLMSMAQHMAAEGVNVLYFSMEMGIDEFIARGISMLSFEKHLADTREETYTTGDILYYTLNPETNSFCNIPYKKYEHLADEYFCRYGRLNIIEGGIKGLSAKDIANICACYQKKCTGEPMAVFVDYLQILQADPADRSQIDRKTKADIAAATLKSLASQIGMPVVAASSISRAGYGGRVLTSSYKESGDLEYTGGVLFGWNWLGVSNSPDAESAAKVKVQCAAGGFRTMALDILKSRNTEGGMSICFRYYPAYSYFVETKGYGELAACSRYTGEQDKKEIVKV